MSFDIDSWQDLAAIATGVGILIAVWQLTAHARLARSSFEDTFAKEYRAVIKAIPTKALLGRKLTPEERTMTLDDFYHYIDLCNEQAYLKRRGRISGRTWREWS